ncbi:MAG: beta-lactamase family protein, partial [Deltaproteobacteria bacterium]|nr:beta-lactamase family protein [Deltaproteobacteria bacterium]
MKILLALLIAATADAPSGTPSGRPAAYATAQNALSRPDPAGLLEDQVRAILAQEHVNAAAVVLVSGDRDVFVRGFGRDASGQPVGDDTLFRLGATSELMVGLLAERLAHENDRFDSPLSRLLVKDDPVVNPFETGTPLTLAHLLEHTSGLEDALPAEDLELPPGKEPEALEDLAKLRPRVVRWRPGSRHSLSAIDTTLAALALQEFAGKPFFRNLAETVLAPLGMFNTTWVLTEDERARTVAMRRGRFLSDAMPRHWAARGLVSNAHDLALLLHMLCTRGRTSSAEFLSEKQLERVEHGLTQPLADKRATAGFGVSPIAADGFDGVQIRGRTEGTLSELTWFPEQGRGLAILVGDGGATTARALLSQTLRRALLSTAARPAPAQVVEVPSAELASKVGYWSPVSPGDRLVAPALRLFGNIELSLSADGKALVLGGLHGPKTRLTPAAGGVFSADGARPAYAFPQEGEHELLLT